MERTLVTECISTCSRAFVNKIPITPQKSIIRCFFVPILSQTYEVRESLIKYSFIRTLQFQVIENLGINDSREVFWSIWLPSCLSPKDMISLSPSLGCALLSVSHLHSQPSLFRWLNGFQHLLAHNFSVYQSLAGQKKGDDYQVSKAKLSNIYYMHLQGSSTKCATESRFKFIIRIQIQIYNSRELPLTLYTALQLLILKNLFSYISVIKYCIEWTFSSFAIILSFLPKVLLLKCCCLTTGWLRSHHCTYIASHRQEGSTQTKGKDLGVTSSVTGRCFLAEQII